MLVSPASADAKARRPSPPIKFCAKFNDLSVFVLRSALASANVPSAPIAFPLRSNLSSGQPFSSSTAAMRSPALALKPHADKSNFFNDRASVSALINRPNPSALSPFPPRSVSDVNRSTLLDAPPNVPRNARSSNHAVSSRGRRTSNSKSRPRAASSIAASAIAFAPSNALKSSNPKSIVALRTALERVVGAAPSPSPRRPAANARLNFDIASITSLAFRDRFPRRASASSPIPFASTSIARVVVVVVVVVASSFGRRFTPKQSSVSSTTSRARRTRSSASSSSSSSSSRRARMRSRDGGPRRRPVAHWRSRQSRARVMVELRKRAKTPLATTASRSRAHEVRAPTRATTRRARATRRGVDGECRWDALPRCATARGRDERTDGRTRARRMINRRRRPRRARRSGGCRSITPSA